MVSVDGQWAERAAGLARRNLMDQICVDFWKMEKK
jgi:hypothetical protein